MPNAMPFLVMPFLAAGAVLLTAGSASAQAQPGWVLSHQKISDIEGGFTGELDNWDFFGNSAASLGDLDGDGVVDLAVAAIGDDDGDYDGAVWVLFLNTDGTVKSHQKISATEGGFTGVVANNDEFASGLAALGDLDGDGVGDLAVGAPSDNDGGLRHGAVWILFLNSDGTVKAHQKISETEGGFTGILDDIDLFGGDLGAFDVDGDGVNELIVGAENDDDGGVPPNAQRGAVWILFLNADGTVISHQKISDTEGGFKGQLENSGCFGSAIDSLGDLDGDGVTDMAVGARQANGAGGIRQGAVWVLFLNNDGTVKAHQKINDTQGGFTGKLNNDQFGYSLNAPGDLDGDGIMDLAVGAYWDNDGGEPPNAQRGAAWILFLNTDGTVGSHQKISDTEGGFSGELEDLDGFGSAVAALGDLDGDGIPDIAVTAGGDEDGGHNRGAVWVLFLDGVAPPDDCPWDLTGDGVVDVHDLLELVHNFGSCDDKECPADINGDGVVNARDLVELVHHFGPCPG